MNRGRRFRYQRRPSRQASSFVNHRIGFSIAATFFSTKTMDAIDFIKAGRPGMVTGKIGEKRS